MRIRVPPEATGTGIGVRAAAKKYGIPVVTVSQWAKRGEVEVLARGTGGNATVFLDEMDLRKRITAYTPHRDSRTHRIKARATPTAPPPSHPHRPQDSPVGALSQARGNGRGGSARIAVRPSVWDLPSQSLYREFYAEMEEAGRAPKTLENYRWALPPFIAAFPSLPFDRQTIFGYCRGLRLEGGSKRLVLHQVKVFYHWLEREKRAPAVDLSRPNLPAPARAPTHWTPEEISRVLHACRHQWEQAIVIALAQTGARREEIASITRDNFHGSWAKVKSKVTKVNPTGHRVLYIPQRASTELALALGAKPTIMLGKAPLNTKNLTNMMRALLKRAGIYKMWTGNHAFRHSWTAEYLNNGGNPLFVDTILGHFTGSIQQHYLHLPQAQVIDEVNRCAPVRFLQLMLPIPDAKGVSP